jgi:hypothetical protein
MNESVFAFGKIFFIPTHKTIPPLTEMSLLILKKNEQMGNLSWRAVCIDLEIDACGNSKDEAWENLKKSLITYINMEVEAAGGSVIEAAKTITQSAFEKSEQKDKYFNIYRQAKLTFTMQAIEKGKLDLVEREKLRLEKLNENDSILSFIEEINEEVLAA